MQIGVHLHINIPNSTTNEIFTGDIPTELMFLAHKVTRQSPSDGSVVIIKDKALATDVLLHVYLTKDDKTFRLTHQGKPENKHVQAIFTKMLQAVYLVNGISEELQIHELAELVKKLTARVQDLEDEVSSLRMRQPIQPAWPPIVPQLPQPQDRPQPWYPRDIVVD